MDPRDSKIVYVGAAEGGVWKSTDGGVSFQPLTDSESSLTIGALAIDPSNPDTVYAGTGDFSRYFYSGVGILRSSDGGRSWTVIGGPFSGPVSESRGGASIATIAIHPTNSRIILVGTAWGDNAGVYRSTDGGVSWKSVLSAAGPGAGVGPLAWKIVFARADGLVVYCALADYKNNGANGLYRSADAGATWTRVGSAATGLPVEQAGFVEFAVAPSAPDILVVALASSASFSAELFGLYKSNDAGATWTKLAIPDYCAEQCWFDDVLSISPVDPNVIYAAGRPAVYQSIDGGNHWSSLTSSPQSGVGLHGDYHSVVFSAKADRLYLGSDGGAWRTDTPGSASPEWISLNASLQTAQIYPRIAIDPVDINVGLAGTQDNSTLSYRGGRWQTAVPGDCGHALIDASSSQNWYASCDIVYRSRDGGSIWNTAYAGIDPNDRKNIVPPLAFDSTNASTLYYGTYRVYRSTDQGTSWIPVSPDLSNGLGGPTYGHITALAISNGSRPFVCAGMNDGSLRIAASPVTLSGWTDISKGLPSRPFIRPISAVTFDAQDANTIYVTFGGWTYGDDQQGHVFRSSDAGQSWTDLSSNLPNAPADDIVLDPDIPGRLYVAMDVGVFESEDGGMSWTRLGSGLPQAIVTTLQFHRPSRTLRAGTFGRGVFDIRLPIGRPYAPSVLNAANYRSGGVSPGEIVTFFGYDLGPPTLQTATIGSSRKFPTSIAQTRILFDGVPAPLLYVSQAQTAAIVPYATASRSTTRMVIELNGVQSSPIDVPVVPSAPGLFSIDSSGNGQAAALNQDLTINSSLNTAARGEIVVLYGTGEGQTMPVGTDGLIADQTYPQPVLPIHASIGGMDAEVLYGGAAPTLVAGVIQVNARVPIGVVPGSAVPVTLRIGSNVSQTVTIAVR